MAVGLQLLEMLENPMMENNSAIYPRETGTLPESQDSAGPQPCYSPAKRNKSSYDPHKEQLSTREIEVLRLVCQELTNHEIGDKLCLSPRTVETYRRTMMEKIGCRNTVGLVLYAVRKGIIEVRGG